MPQSMQPSPADAELPKTILVVEDEVLVRLVISDYLRECGYQVVEAAGTDEAKQVLQSGTKVDLIFSDVQLPGQADGIALASWVKEQYPGIPVILTSGWAGAAEKARDLCHEGPLVVKPYGHGMVLQRIQSLLSGAQRQDRGQT